LKDYNDEDIKCWYYTAKNFVPVDGQVINVDGTRQFVFTTTHFSTFMATTETIFNDYAAAEGLSPGITLSGKVKSYNPKNELSITLKDAENNTIQATTISTPTETSGLTTQDFTFTGVAPGTYDLVVQKDGHLDYTIKSVVVGEKDIDLTQMTGKAYQTITLLAGDVNGDGKIFANDFKLIRENLMKTGSAISDTRADINGDGKVFANDFTPVRTNLMKTAANCSFSYI